MLPRSAVRRRTWLCAGLLGLFAAAAPAKSKDPVKVEVRLSVRPSGREVLATLVFANRSNAPQYVDKRMGCLDGRMRTRVFDVRTGGREMHYLGVMGKLAAPGPNDYLTLSPGEEVETQVHLEDAFELLPGKHTYRIRYDAFHGRPDSDALDHRVSNEARVTIVR